uniref:Uncharacterized protein n=1 Tax=Melanopsichium pennsylvanicum 4 TaxID=1398559 RepID=A0A077QQV7_9BASI|nr:putative protein (C-terminal fragment) [Melanopsichium pennsylvanicum 4]
MPLAAAGLRGARPPPIANKPRNGSTHTGPSKSNPMLPPLPLDHHDDDDDDDDDDQETTDDSSDEDAAFKMDGQELWTQTYCLTCDCLIEPGEGIAKAHTSTHTALSALGGHTTLKSRSGTIKARGSNESDTSPADHTKTPAAASKQSPTATKSARPSPLKRTNSAGRLHAKPGNGPLGPHKRTGSAGSRLHALSELRPTTKLNQEKGKAKLTTRDTGAPVGRKSPAASRPSSAASNRSNSNSSGPSSFKSNEATAAASANGGTDTLAQVRARKRGFLGGLGLTPAALKQQQAEMAAKRRAPTPLYCSERCRLIDERRSSGLGELAQYLSQPLAPTPSAAWAPPPPPPPFSTWTTSASVSSMPIPVMANTPDSDCMCPECLDKYADGSSASGAAIPSGASDTATESSGGYVHGRAPAQKLRTASGRLITPLGLHAPGANEGYFPQFAPQYATNSAGLNSPRLRPADAAPPRSSSAASGGKASTAGTEGSILSSESGSSLWELRLKPRSNSAVRNSNGSNSTLRNGNTANVSANGAASGSSTNTATPAITPRQSMIVPSSSNSQNAIRASHRLSVPGFEPTHEVDEDFFDAHRAISPAANLPHRPSFHTQRSSVLLATSPLKLLDKASQHHAAPSVDLFSDHVGSPGTRGSLLSRSLASEHTLMGASGITLTNQQAPQASTSMHGLSYLDSVQSMRRKSQDSAPGRRPSTLSQSFSNPSQLDQSSQGADSVDGLSMAVGSLKLAQIRASGPLVTASRRDTDGAGTRPGDLRRLSLFGVAGAPARRNSNAISISSSNSGSTTSGWLRSLSSAWLNWRSTASPAPVQADNDVFHSTDDSDEWPSRSSGQASRRESSASRSSSHHKVPYAQKRASSVRDMSVAGSLGQSSSMRPSEMTRHTSEDRSSGITPTQSLVAKPTIRRGHVPAYVREIGQGGIPGDSSPAEAKAEEATDPAQRLSRARVDSLTRAADAEAQRKTNRRRSRDISVLPPLLAPISRSGSSTNLYSQMPRSARAYSAGRAWTAANTPQLYVGSAGSSVQQQPQYPAPPHSPTLMRSPCHSSFALAQDAARAALSPSRPTSAAGHHGYSAGTSPRAKGLGWGVMTSIASPPTGAREQIGPTPSVPEDGGEMSSQDLTSGDFVSRPNSAMAMHTRRHHRTSLMPPPRSRSSLGMQTQRLQPLTSAGGTQPSEDDGVDVREEGRTWSYNQLKGLKTYPILQLPERGETHDVYDAAWGLGDGGLARHLGKEAKKGEVVDKCTSRNAKQGGGGCDGDDDEQTKQEEAYKVRVGFQNHGNSRKKLFFFDA